MKLQLYEFIVEVQGERNTRLREFVLAPNDLAVWRHARQFALRLVPGARHDPELNLFVAPEGWPEWTISTIQPVRKLTVPVAGASRGAAVALVPWGKDVREAAVIAAEVLRKIADPGNDHLSVAQIKERIDLSDEMVGKYVAILDRVAG
jgi:hypothetical protein